MKTNLILLSLFFLFGSLFGCIDNTNSVYRAPLQENTDSPFKYKKCGLIQFEKSSSNWFIETESGDTKLIPKSDAILGQMHALSTNGSVCLYSNKEIKQGFQSMEFEVHAIDLK